MQETQLIWLVCSRSGFQRLGTWGTELKGHSRSAPICLGDSLQASSAKGHYLQGQALPVMDAKHQTYPPGLDTDTTWETKGEQRKQNLYNPSGFSYHLGQEFPKSSLHITEGMGNNAFIIIGNIQGWAKVGLHFWGWETEFMFVLSFINYCIIFHTNNRKPTFANPCMDTFSF